MASNEEIIAGAYEKSYGRGDFFRGNQEYDKAISEYVQAMKKFIALAQIIVDEGGGKNSLLDANFQLARLYYIISICYREEYKYGQSLACLNKFIKVRNSIETSGITLDAEQLQQCKDFQESATQGIALVKIRRQSNPDRSNNEDPLFKSISSLPTSLLDLPKTRSSNDVSACFIATAAYSTSFHPDLDTFRQFRDNRLLTNIVGKLLVSLYYTISPSLARHIEKQPAIKHFLRRKLECLALWMRNHKL